MNCLIWSAAFCQETTSGSDSAISRVASGTPAGQQLIYTLPECVARGLKENPRIKAAESDIRKAGSQIGAQRGNFFPTLSASTFAQELQSLQAKGPTESDYLDQDIGVMDFRISQTLFQGFTIFNTYQKAVLGEELSRAQKEQAEMDLILEIQTTFLKLLKASEDARSLESAVKRLEINEKSAAAFYAKQMAPYVAVLQSRVDLADAQQQLSQAKNEVETQKVMMNLLLGIPAEAPVIYEGQPSLDVRDADWDLGNCLVSANQHRPEIKVAEKSIQMAQKDLAIQLGKFSPRISANYDYYMRNTDYKNEELLVTGETYDRDQENTYWTAMIQMQWEFNLGGQQFYQQAGARHEVERLFQHRKDMEDRISAQVRTSFLRLEEAKGRIETSGGALEAARESYDRAKKWSQVQMGTISDLLDIQAKLTRAEANRNNAVSDYRLSLAELYYSMGRRNDGLTESHQCLTEPLSGGNSN
ncbi:MAG: TolC family protein [Desulfosalsimonadaceae bacterium]